MTLSNLINQKSYEKIKYTLRRHPVTFIPALLMFFVLLAVPVGIYWLIINSSLVFLLQDPAYSIILILVLSAYVLSAILFSYTYFVAFYLDLWVITNDRILDMEQKSLFARTIAEVDLYQIQDATSEVKGLFPSLFNYGNVVLQTAGPVPKFIFKNISNPHSLREIILDLSAEDKKFHEKNKN